MSATDEPFDGDRIAEIRSVRRVATGILCALSVIFFASFAVSDPPYWLLLIRAMAEAGMVGGLADWFAVEALFRHPLKLPIPHTALLPKNQKRAAGNIARFIDEYFLVPDQLLAQVRKINPAGLLFGWLSKPDNAGVVARELSNLLQLILKYQLQRGLGPEGNRFVREMVLTSVNPKGLSRNLSTLLKDAVHSRLLDDILLEVRNVLDQNRGKVTEIVQDRSRWWIASSVDKQFVRLLVDGLLSIIDELSDGKSKLRAEFDSSVVHLIDDLHKSGHISSYIEEGRRKYADSPEFETTVDAIVGAILGRAERTLEDDPQRVAGMIAGAITEFADTVRKSPELEAQLNDRLLDAMTSVLDNIRPAIVDYISKVIEEWDSEELVERMENEVGRDLQFIRINGAVLGAFVGGALFVLTSAFH